MTQIPTICLVNCYADDNKGDNGIILATVLGLKAAYQKHFNKTPEVIAVSTFGRRDIEQSGAHRLLKKFVDGVVPNSVPQRYHESSTLGRKFTKAISVSFNIFTGLMGVGLYRLTGVAAVLAPDQQAILAAHIVVSKGGSIFYSDGSLSRNFLMARMFAPLIFAILLGRPTYVFAQSMGPFKGWFSQTLARWVLRRCKRVYARESYSEAELKSIGVVNVSVCPDAAFLLVDFYPPAQKSSGQHKKYLGVTARVLSTNPIMQARFEDKMTDVLDRFLKQYPNWRVTLIGQVVGPEKHQDDRRVQRRIRKQMPPATRKRVFSEDQDFSVPDVLKVYADLDLMLGTRLHSSIFSATQGVPPVVLEYEQKKAAGTYKLMKMEQWVLNWQDDGDVIFKKLVQSVEHLSKRQKEIKKAVTKSVKQLKHVCEEMIRHA